MAISQPLKVVLCWHMHQPEYRDLHNGDYKQPWVYLHTIKDYVDMAAHLEKHSNARAVVNFAPVLLEQIDDYAQQISAYLNNTCALHDSLLKALVDPALPSNTAYQQFLIQSCLRANNVRLIERFSAYKRLVDMSGWLIQHPDDITYLNNQYIFDLLVWYHLAWLGETVRRDNTQVQFLINKGGGFNLQDRCELLSIIGDLLKNIIGRYRALADQQQIELSMTPYAHTIIPLLLQLASASEALPNIHLPILEHYPHGAERARWHLQHGIQTFEHYFGFKPKGCWPSEGGLSTETIELLDEYGFQWTASGGNVLKQTLNNHNHPHSANDDNKVDYLYQSYQLNNMAIRCFFRDDALSDLIGFTYSDWHADDAVAHFISQLEEIAHHPNVTDESIVSIILDGENAWEYYPQNAFYSLETLYQRLGENPLLHLTTFQEGLFSHTTRIPNIIAGSWVYGTFSTWIGDEEKNRAWDILGDVKRCFDRVVASGRLDQQQLQKAEKQLAVCEGSDWFWWFSDYNPSDTVSEFEQLYRLHIANLYQLLHHPPPSLFIRSLYTRWWSSTVGWCHAARK